MDYRCGASQAAHKESEPQTRVQWRSRSAPTAPRQQRDEFGDTRIGSTNEVPENTTGTSSTTRMGPCEVIAVTVSRLPLLSSMVDTAGLLRVSTVCDAPVSINLSAAQPLMDAVTMRCYCCKSASLRLLCMCS